MNDVSNDISALMPPGELTGPSVWYGRDYQGSDDWVHHLSGAEIAEVESAIAHANAMGREIMELSPETFEIPRLGERLAKIRTEILEGCGFAVMRGLPVEGYDLRTAAMAFFGIGSHIGTPRSQNSEGHLVGHVCDLSHNPAKNPHQRGYRAAGPLGFHTDSADIAALLTWRKSKSGGDGKIASSVTVYNEMRRRAPALLRALFGPVNRDRRGEVPEGMKPWWTMPIFQWHAGYLNSHFNHGYILSSDRFDELEPMSDILKEAFEVLMDICEEVHLKVDYQPGDIGLVNNHQILHGRADYEDWPEVERRRYLLRLWLSPEDGRPLPAAYAQRYGNVVPGQRGGIICPETKLKAPLEPI